MSAPATPRRTRRENGKPVRLHNTTNGTWRHRSAAGAPQRKLEGEMNERWLDHRRKRYLK